jgi:hypothetical protein
MSDDRKFRGCLSANYNVPDATFFKEGDTLWMKFGDWMWPMQIVGPGEPVLAKVPAMMVGDTG